MAIVVSNDSSGSGLSMKTSDIDITIFENSLFKNKDDVWSMKVDEEYANVVAKDRSTIDFYLIK